MSHLVAVPGEGGKVGLRVTKLLHDAGHVLRAVEIRDVGRERLAEAGIPVVEAATGLDGAGVVVLALPDRVIGLVTAEIAPMLRTGAMLPILDAAAHCAGVLPKDRPDLTCFVGHPCGGPAGFRHDRPQQGGLTVAGTRRSHTGSLRGVA